MASRADRLAKFFSLILSGKRTVTTIENFTLLLESIQEQSDHAVCVERIIASPPARTAIHTGIRLNIKPDFLNSHTYLLIQYLTDPAVKNLCNGQILHDILDLVLEPATVWNAFMKAFLGGQLTEPATQAFIWLLIELLAQSSVSQIDVVGDATKVDNSGFLLRATSPETRRYGQTLHQILQLRTNNTIVQDVNHIPGGRHDNDHADFRQIAIYPTHDEFRSSDKPFYRRAEEIQQLPVDARVAGHLDNQFRLLREDMLSEIREELQVAGGQKKKRRKATLLQGLFLKRISHGTDKWKDPCGLVISCLQGLESLTSRDKEGRKAFLKNDRGYLRHQSFGCLLRGQEIISFATIDRQVDHLLEDPPSITLRVIGGEAVRKTLSYFKVYSDIQFLLVDAPVFAYEPILKRLKEKVDLPLSGELLSYERGCAISHADIFPPALADSLGDENTHLQDMLKTDKPIFLDPSQKDSLLSGLTQSVSLIQGPPGTGKSFVGALIAKALFLHSKETVLVMCYTNHALDQFLEDLMDIGITHSAIVRLGSKSSQRTEPLSLSAQQSRYFRTSAQWSIINELNGKFKDLHEELSAAFNAYSNFKLNYTTIIEFLEFEDPSFFAAFTPPEKLDGMTLVGEGGESVTGKYLFDRWLHGKNHSMPSLSHLNDQARQVWEMDESSRQAKITSWSEILLEEQVANVQSLMARMDNCQGKLSEMWSEKKRDILKSKRIIGCTTTAAAMNANDLSAISPGVVLLEEAGEILESHVLTALGSHTKQLIMIGDHQQLRPKINNYALSVEKGSGYDLNRSLFERLVEAGYPHSTLAKQHRMVPEISSLVRHLTYPDLLDDDKTLSRPAPRGLQDHVIFLDHTHAENTLRDVSDRNDVGGKGYSRYSSFSKLLNT